MGNKVSKVVIEEAGRIVQRINGAEEMARDRIVIVCDPVTERIDGGQHVAELIVSELTHLPERVGHRQEKVVRVESVIGCLAERVRFTELVVVRIECGAVRLAERIHILRHVAFEIVAQHIGVAQPVHNRLGAAIAVMHAFTAMPQEPGQVPNARVFSTDQTHRYEHSHVAAASASCSGRGSVPTRDKKHSCTC